MSRQRKGHVFRCRCGSNRFVRRLTGPVIDTPCRIDLAAGVLHMDFAAAGRSYENAEFTFRCAACGARLDEMTTEKINSRFEVRSTESTDREAA